MSRWYRWWHVRDSEEGLGLLEVMIAIFVLAVALLALASVGTSSLSSLRITRDREQATNAASAALEEARTRNFSGLALTPGTVSVSALPPGAAPAGSTDACFGGEPVITDAVVDPIDFAADTGNLDRIRVYTVVTYAETGCTAGSRSDLKRVIAIATWSDGGVLRFVQQDTLVVDAGRGLPVPKFEVRPPESSLSFSKAYLTDSGISDKSRCVEHQLRNLGAEDSYDWELAAVDTGLAPLLFGNGYLVGGWEVKGYLDYPAVASRAGDPPPFSQQMTGSPRPASDDRIEPGDTATFTVCYTPAVVSVDEDTGPWPDDIVATVVVRSRFDDRQERELTHHVTVRDQAAPGTGLFLFDRNDSNAHDRRITLPNGTLAYAPSVMGPLAAPDDDPSLVSHLGTIDYTQVSRSNWSTEMGQNSHPGVRFTRPSGAAREVGPDTLAWHHQFLAPTILLPDATLILWQAPTNALSGSGLPVGGQPVELEIRLDGLHSNEKNVVWSGISTTFSYTHTTSTSPEWEKLEIPLNLGGEVSFQSSRYLRLRVTCAPSNTVDCNVAYDNVAYPAAIYVQVK